MLMCHVACVWIERSRNKQASKSSPPPFLSGDMLELTWSIPSPWWWIFYSHRTLSKQSYYLILRKQFGQKKPRSRIQLAVKKGLFINDVTIFLTPSTPSVTFWKNYKSKGCHKILESLPTLRHLRYLRMTHKIISCKNKIISCNPILKYCNFWFWRAKSKYWISKWSRSRSVEVIKRKHKCFTNLRIIGPFTTPQIAYWLHPMQMLFHSMLFTYVELKGMKHPKNYKNKF